jgi:hypothetical protein
MMMGPAEVFLFAFAIPLGIFSGVAVAYGVFLVIEKLALEVRRKIETLLNDRGM